MLLTQILGVRRAGKEYVLLTLVSMWKAHDGKSLIDIFGDFLASSNKIFILAWGMGTWWALYEA